MSKPISILPHCATGLLLCAISTLIFIQSGCAKSESPEPAKPAGATTRTAASQDQVAGSYSADVLSGVWLGTAALNENKLKQKLVELPLENQQVPLAKARSFMSTVMAIEYRSDGTVENDLEIVSIDGQLMRDGSQGTWKVIESDSDGLVVETQERLSDGSIANDRVYYEFSQDGNQFTMAVPVGDELEGCDAVMVFERQSLSPINVAQQGSDTQTK